MHKFVDIIKGTSKEEFFEKYYGQRLLRSHLGIESVLTLIDWDKFNSLLDITTVHNGKNIGYSKSGEAEFNPSSIWLQNGKLSSQEVSNLISTGHTFIINSIHTRLNSFDSLANDMQSVFREDVNFNIYLSQKPEVGFGLHWDDHDVFAIQVYGRKYWKVFGFSEPHPLERKKGKQFKEHIEPIWEGYLEQGDCLYLPRGMWHSVVSTGIPSMHITCGVNGFTSIDILNWMVAHAKDCDLLRKGIAPNCLDFKDTSDAIQDWVSDFLKVNPVERYWDDKQAHRSPRSIANFPSSLNVTWTSNSDACKIRYMGPENPLTWNSDNSTFVVINGKEYKFDLDIKPLVDLIFENIEHDSKQILNKADDIGASDKLLELLKTLEYDGVISRVNYE